MSTKGLIADKRVAHVELNSLGKAASLTLADGWTYNGSPGPFALDNVDHGHKIVKAAVNPNAPGRKAKSPRAAPEPREPYEGPKPPSEAEVAAIKPNREIPQVYIYRTILIDKAAKQEVAGWVKATYRYDADKLERETRELCGRVMRAKGGDPDTATVASFRWKNEHEQGARRQNSAGCPWPMEVTA